MQADSTALLTIADLSTVWVLGSHVFAVINDRRFERRLIVPAPDAEGRLRVTSGLRVGVRVR